MNIPSRIRSVFTLIFLFEQTRKELKKINDDCGLLD